MSYAPILVQAREEIAKLIRPDLATSDDRYDKGCCAGVLASIKVIDSLIKEEK